MHVACAVEGRYDVHSAVMLHSVLAHSPDRPVLVHYLHGASLNPRFARKLSEMVARLGHSVSFYDIPEGRVADLPAPDYFTRAMWYRLLLPELLPDVARVLYLDVDTVAVDDLGPLWQIDLGQQYLGAVTNVFWIAGHAERVASLGLRPESYFNSGVLMLNLKQLRADDCSAKIRDVILRRKAELLWPDQDALNLTLGDHRVALHPRWNCMNSFGDFPAAAGVFGRDMVMEARGRPGIRHFEGPGHNKPWHLLCEQEGRREYFRHRRQTPWPLVRRSGMTAGNVLRRVGLLPRQVAPPLRP